MGQPPAGKRSKTTLGLNEEATQGNHEQPISLIPLNSGGGG